MVDENFPKPNWQSTENMVYCYSNQITNSQREVINMKKSYMTILYKNISDAMLIAEFCVL